MIPPRVSRLDDDWFVRERPRLLRRHAPAESYPPHGVASLVRGSRLAGSVHDNTEAAIAHLSPRHGSAVRAHMQLYRACLETLGFVPSDALVNAAVQIEWLWYSTPLKGQRGFYRDHLAHVMKVATLGLWLLEAKESPFARDGEPLAEHVARELARGARGHWGCRALRAAARRTGVAEVELSSERFWRDAVLEATRVAGLLHDMAYAEMMRSKVTDAAAAARPRVPFEERTDDHDHHAVALLGDRLVATSFHAGELPGRDGLDAEAARACAAVFRDSHSLRAGYAILRMAEQANRAWQLTPFDAFVVEWASLAASMHDYDKLFELRPGGKHPKRHQERLAKWLHDDANLTAIRPRFDRDPVSFIVALADQLQDFGRLHYARANPEGGSQHDTATVEGRYPCSAVELRIEGEPPGERLTVVFEHRVAGANDAPTSFQVSEAFFEGSKTRKQADERLIAGLHGWLDPTGLLAPGSIKYEVRAAAP